MSCVRNAVLLAVMSACLFSMEPAALRAQVSVKSPRELACERAILAALKRPCYREFNELRLEDCINAFREDFAIPIAVDSQALTDNNVAVDRPITFSASGVTGQAALDRLLHELSLTWVIANETLTIIPRNDESKHLDTRVYPVSDLVAAETKSESLNNLDSLFEVISTAVDPTSWECVGGAGSMRTLDARLSLVVSQTRRNHEQISLLLDTIRSLEGLSSDRHYAESRPDQNAGFVATPSATRKNRATAVGALGVAKSPRDLACEKAIVTALTRPVWRDFYELPLGDCLLALEGDLMIPIAIDTKALTDLGIPADRPVTFKASGETARAALNRMLRGLDLAWIMQNETLVITTVDEAHRALEIRVYPVRDLALPDVGRQREPDFDGLIDLITSTVRPTSWDNVGGAGSIKGLDTNLSLVISQTREVHEQLELLLEKIRAVGGLQRIGPFIQSVATESNYEPAEVSPPTRQYRMISAQPSWRVPRLHQ